MHTFIVQIDCATNPIFIRSLLFIYFLVHLTKGVTEYGMKLTKMGDTQGKLSNLVDTRYNSRFL